VATSTHVVIFDFDMLFLNSTRVDSTMNESTVGVKESELRAKVIRLLSDLFSNPHILKVLR
jgi:hypothetical protein